MTRLVWNQQAQIKYENGIDRGVFYPSDGPGVVWNSLLTVEESHVGGDQIAYYFDGVKTLDMVTPKNYQANITALTIPKQAETAIGFHSVVPGFILTRQPRARFGLCYRTLIGDFGYKIHIVYNALATRTDSQHETVSDSPSAEEFAWLIDAVPPPSDTYRPSAHYILNSLEMDPNALDVLEDILYGNDRNDARLPTPGEIIGLTSPWNPIYIVPQAVTGLAQLVPGIGDLYEGEIDGLLRALPSTRLIPSSISGLYRLE